MTNWNAAKGISIKFEEGRIIRGVPTPSGNLLASSGNTNDNALAPTLVASLEGSTHNTNVTSAVKGVVAATIGHLNQVLLDSLALELGRVDKVGGTELTSPRLLTIVHIDGNDHASLVLDSTLHDRQTDTAHTKDSHVGALLDLGGLDGGTVAGGDTTAQQTGAVGGDLGSHRDDGDIGDNGVL